jgi:hypothetical protein
LLLDDHLHASQRQRRPLPAERDRGQPLSLASFLPGSGGLGCIHGRFASVNAALLEQGLHQRACGCRVCQLSCTRGWELEATERIIFWVVEKVSPGVPDHSIVEVERCLRGPVQSAIACALVAKGKANAAVQGNVYLSVRDADTHEIRLVFCRSQSDRRVRGREMLALIEGENPVPVAEHCGDFREILLDHRELKLRASDRAHSFLRHPDRELLAAACSNWDPGACERVGYFLAELSDPWTA